MTIIKNDFYTFCKINFNLFCDLILYYKSSETNIHFEESHAPWQRRLNLVFGIGVALALFLYGKGMLEASMLIGIMLFVFDLFGPLKALYGQSTRLTVMNSCMDRIEEVFAESELPDTGSEHIPAAERLREGVPEVEFRDVSFSYGKGGIATTKASSENAGMEAKEALRHVSFQMNRNEMTALVGTSDGGNPP